MKINKPINIKREPNPFKYALDNKRYHTYNYHLKLTFGDKIAKICLDGGFTCPNRDGTISSEGCLFCSDGASSRLISSKDNLLKQYNDYKNQINQKWKCSKFIAYFQAFSNTYAPLEELKRIYQPFIDLDEVVAINIATRPDCLDAQIIDYLSSIKKPIYVELGLQTSSPITAKLINRGYDYQTFAQVVRQLRTKGINVIVHVINGLPHETKEDNLKTVKDLVELGIDGIKFHSLFIIKDTPLYRYYLEHPWPLLSQEDYLDILIGQIELLPPQVVVHRISGDPDSCDLFHPLWAVDKTNFRNCLDKEMKKRNTLQGRCFF